MKKNRKQIVCCKTAILPQSCEKSKKNPDMRLDHSENSDLIENPEHDDDIILQISLQSSLCCYLHHMNLPNTVVDKTLEIIISIRFEFIYSINRNKISKLALSELT